MNFEVLSNPSHSGILWLHLQTAAMSLHLMQLLTKHLKQEFFWFLPYSCNSFQELLGPCPTAAGLCHHIPQCHSTHMTEGGDKDPVDDAGGALGGRCCISVSTPAQSCLTETSPSQTCALGAPPSLPTFSAPLSLQLEMQSGLKCHRSLKAHRRGFEICSAGSFAPPSLLLPELLTVPKTFIIIFHIAKQ